MDRTILIVGDDIDNLKLFERMLSKKKLKCLMANSAQKGLDLFKIHKPKIVILDFVMPKMNGIDLMEIILQHDPQVSVVIVTGFGTIEKAVEAIKKGAYDFITKPIQLIDFSLLIDRILKFHKLLQEHNLLQTKLDQLFGVKKFVGKSPQIRKVLEQVTQVCKTDSTVLITGESGTGKELIANALHYSGVRKAKPFIKVNSASIPENIIESEFFGHEKGSFTSAITKRIGRFELADGGTLFLDEIGDMPLASQVKLLRVLETKEFERVGGKETIKVDVRLIVATNRDLECLVSKNEFRSDLYYRLNVINIDIPPLRERKEDISVLAYYFLKKFAIQMNKPINKISPKVLNILESHNWQGNVRELLNTIERAVVFCKKNIITEEDLPADILSEVYGLQRDFASPLYSLALVEKNLLKKVLIETQWNLKKAAELLDIHRTTLYSKIEKFKIKKQDVLLDFNP